MKIFLQFLTILISLSPTVSVALELGFESSLLADISDNVFFESDASKVDGKLGEFRFSLFGEQKSSSVEGGFLAEFRTERLFDVDNDRNLNYETFTRFYGGMSVATPLRSLNWYFGDVLSGVLDENRLQSIDSTGDRQLNIFITGPEISHQTGDRKTLDFRLYYANQNDDTFETADSANINDELADLYNLSTSVTSDLGGGRTWGFRLSDIYTDKPDSVAFKDYNRLSSVLFVERKRGVTLLDVELGGTQYHSDDEGTAGLRFALGYSRDLSDRHSLSLRASHDLIDQTLDTFEDLSAGQAARDAINGISAETVLRIDLQSQLRDNSSYFRLAAVESDFKLVADVSGFSSIGRGLHDNRLYVVSMGFSRGLSTRLRALVDARLERLEYLNRSDEIDSLSVSGKFSYALNNRWSLEIGAKYLMEEGSNNVLVGERIIIDATENRAFLGIRWAPPTRASRDVVGAVRSFL